MKRIIKNIFSILIPLTLFNQTYSATTINKDVTLIDMAEAILISLHSIPLMLLICMFVVGIVIFITGVKKLAKAGERGNNESKPISIITRLVIGVCLTMPLNYSLVVSGSIYGDKAKGFDKIQTDMNTEAKCIGGVDNKCLKY